jgi:hypothetical protein
MGFFSWKTADTGRSVSNWYSSKPTFQVHLWVPGKKVATEEAYEGYGEFDGHDYYDVFVDANKDHPEIRKREESPEDYREKRNIGISVCLAAEDGRIPRDGLVFPQLTEKDEEPKDFSVPLANCECQGYFYDD